MPAHPHPTRQQDAERPERDQQDRGQHGQGIQRERDGQPEQDAQPVRGEKTFRPEGLARRGEREEIAQVAQKFSARTRL